MMADSTGTNLRSITVDMPDYASTNIIFRLVSSVAIADVGEIFPQKSYTLTLDANGTGTQQLPCPDSTGNDAWLWRVEFPDDTMHRFSLAYDASSITLATILASSVSTVTPSDLTALLALYLPLTGGTLSGALTVDALTTLNNSLAIQGNITTTGASTWSSTDSTIDISNLVDTAQVVSATISGATYALDPTTARKFNLTLESSPTITLGTSGVVDGDSFIVALTQDNTGSRVVTWDTVIWGDNGEPTLSIGGGSVDFITFIFHDSRWHGFLGGLGF